MKYYKEYLLKNGKTLIVRSPEENDAEEIMNLVKTADTETRYLSREPGEFTYSLEEEKIIIQNKKSAENTLWTISIIDNKIVGMAETRYNNRKSRFRHKGNLGLFIIKKYWDMGIGGKLMLSHIEWSKQQNLELLIVEVVSDNQRSIDFYKSFGFDIVGTVDNGMKYSDGTYADEHTMVMHLKDTLYEDVGQIYTF